MRAVAVLLLAGCVAACNVQARHDTGNGDGNVAISGGEDGKLSFDLPFAKGEVKLPQGSMRNGEFDIDGVKMFPGGHITGFAVIAADKGTDVDIAFHAPAPPDKVRAYFLDEFGKKGIEASASGDAVTGTSKDGSRFEIHVQPNGGGSQGSVKIHSKD
jgi:hypothetical protein